jgi:hypothetical protein
VGGEPADQRQECDAEEHRPGRRPEQRRDDPGQEPGREQDQGRAGARAHRQAGQLQPFAADGEDDEADQPGQQQGNRHPAEPEDQRARGQDSAQGLDEDGVVPLPPPQRHVDADE